MLCPNCKKEIPEGSQVCHECNTSLNAPAHPAKKQKKPVTKKWWFWMIIVVVVIALVGAVSGGGDDTSTSTDGENLSQNQSVETTKAVETTTAVDNIFDVGETLDVNGLEIKYVSSEEWKGYNQYSAPQSGNKVIRLKFEFANNGSADQYVSPYEFSCYADNNAATVYYSDEEYLDTINLSSGRTISGYVYFEVPENSEVIEVEYETSYWTSEKAVFTVVL